MTTFTASGYIYKCSRCLPQATQGDSQYSAQPHSTRESRDVFLQESHVIIIPFVICAVVDGFLNLQFCKAAVYSVCSFMFLTATEIFNVRNLHTGPVCCLCQRRLDIQYTTGGVQHSILNL